MCTVFRSCSWSNGYDIVLQLGLGLGLGTGNGYFISFFFPYLKVTNIFVLPSWAEAWCKCDVMLFIRDCLRGSLPEHLYYLNT